MEYGDQPDICLREITNSLAILRLKASLKPQPGWPATGFEPATSRMRVSCVTTEPPRLVATIIVREDRIRLRTFQTSWKCHCVPPTRWKLINCTWDNARPHITNVIAEYLSNINVKCVLHPPFSQDLATCDFILFQNMKKHLCGRNFSLSGAVVKAT